MGHAGMDWCEEKFDEKRATRASVKPASRESYGFALLSRTEEVLRCAIGRCGFGIGNPHSTKVWRYRGNAPPPARFPYHSIVDLSYCKISLSLLLRLDEPSKRRVRSRETQGSGISSVGYRAEYPSQAILRQGWNVGITSRFPETGLFTRQKLVMLVMLGMLEISL